MQTADDGDTGERDSNVQGVNTPAATTASSVGDSPTVRQVELAPGVSVTQALNGFTALGVPIGQDTWVTQEAVKTIESHEARLITISNNHHKPRDRCGGVQGRRAPSTCRLGYG